jgi:molybdenum cofactor synthesis domain-containing protein
MPARSEKVTPPEIHLAAIGNELLNAEIRDTNLAWLIRFLARRGGRIGHASIVPDDFGAIKREIDLAIDRKADLLITTGGLGPTDDDATLAAVGAGLRRKMALDKTALRMVRDRLEFLAKMRRTAPHRLTRERKTMAIFPDGGVPLHNPVGVAPGMILRIDRLTIISLPGVPVEMKGIAKVTLRDFWRDFFKGVVYVKRNISIEGIPEADLWPYVRRANRLDPGVYIKSRLKMRSGNPLTAAGLPRYWIILHFSVVDGSKANGLSRIDRLIESVMGDLNSHYKAPFRIL